MAQTDPWLLPAAGAQPQTPAPAGVVVPAPPPKPEKPEKPTETFETLTPDQLPEGLNPAGVYQKSTTTGKIVRVDGGAGAVAPKTAAANLLLSAGVDAETGIDPVSELIKGSTSGDVETWFANKYGSITGESTAGMQNIAKLKTIVSDMTLQLTGGSLGAGVSNADVTFLKERVGNLADPTVPSDERLAAWSEVKSRLQRVTGVTPPPPPLMQIYLVSHQFNQVRLSRLKLTLLPSVNCRKHGIAAHQLREYSKLISKLVEAQFLQKMCSRCAMHGLKICPCGFILRQLENPQWRKD